MKGLFGSSRFQAATSAVLALGLFAFFLTRVHLSEIAASIRSASPGWIVASVLISLSTFAFRALRWVWILEPVGRVPWWPSYRATSIGFAANTVLPARAGEVLRPAILARERSLPFAALLASIVFERILDALSQLTYLGIALGTGAAAGSVVSSGRLRLAVAVLAGIAIAVALFAVLWRDATERFFDAAFRILPEKFRPLAHRVAHTFLDGFASLKTPRLAALVGVGSLLLWLVINVQVYCVLRAFGLALPFSAAFVTTSAAVLGLVVPTPGGVGGYHAAVQFALTRVYGVPIATATGVALIAHAVSFVPISLIGFALFATSPIRKSGWKQLSSTPEAPQRPAKLG